jgi:hypothetical protein
MDDDISFLKRMEEYFQQRQAIDASVFQMTAIMQGNEKVKQQLEEMNIAKRDTKMS